MVKLSWTLIMCSAFFPTILGSFQEELKGWGRRTWTTTGLSYNPVLTPTRAAPVLLSSPHHITKSEERGLPHLSLSKSDSSDRSLEILWFWNIKVCPKWDLPGDILIRVNQHDFLPWPSIDRFQIIVSQLKPTCACLLGNIFRNPCVFHSGKFIWGNTWGCELRGWQSNWQNPCHGHIPSATETTGIACLSDLLAYLFTNAFSWEINGSSIFQT